VAASCRRAGIVHARERRADRARLEVAGQRAPHGRDAVVHAPQSLTASSARRMIALGCSVHTGWAVVVAISGPAKAPSIVARHRVELAENQEARFAYHR